LRLPAPLPLPPLLWSVPRQNEKRNPSAGSPLRPAGVTAALERRAEAEAKLQSLKNDDDDEVVTEIIPPLDGTKTHTNEDHEEEEAEEEEL